MTVTSGDNPRGQAPVTTRDDQMATAATATRTRTCYTEAVLAQ